MILSLSVIVTADSKQNKPMGSFMLKDDKVAGGFNNNNYIPLSKVAESLDYELEWNLDKGKAVGKLNNFSFRTENFIVYHGQLYIPIDIMRDYFRLIIEFKGNHYYIYRFENRLSNFDLELQTNKHHYDKAEPIGISLLLFNDSDERLDIKYSSGQKFDLVLKRFGKEVWRWSDNKGFIALITVKSLNPDDYLLYTELIYPWRDTFFPDGEYELQAEIPTVGGKIYSETVDIIIE